MAVKPIHTEIKTYYLFKVNKKDVELFKNSEMEHLFFIRTELIKSKSGLFLIGEHGFIKAKLISQSFDKNKLVGLAIKYNKI